MNRRQKWKAALLQTGVLSPVCGHGHGGESFNLFLLIAPLSPPGGVWALGNKLVHSTKYRHSQQGWSKKMGFAYATESLVTLPSLTLSTLATPGEGDG
jgi:hypothetical protein